MTLPKIASYRIDAPRNSFHLVLNRGSVVDFAYPPRPARAALVNAANEGCLGGGGVDGALGAAGGPALRRDRRRLPESPAGSGVRCRAGGAVTTGPGEYGTLRVPYVVHAVGPDYRERDPDDAADLADGDARLASAYRAGLARGEEAGLEALAFCLLSAGTFRGPRSLEAVLRVGLRAVVGCGGYAGLKEVHVCAFTQEEATALVTVADELGLTRIDSAKRGAENDTAGADAAESAASANGSLQKGRHDEQQQRDGGGKQTPQEDTSADNASKEPRPEQGQHESGGGPRTPPGGPGGAADAREEWELRRDDLKDEGDAHFRARAYAPAIAAYGAALQLDPAHAVLLSNKSAAHLAHGEKSRALQDAQRCVAAAPSWAKGRTRLAAAMASLGRHHEAAGVYAKVLEELDPENAAAQRGLEACRGRQRRAREAREREAQQLQAELDRQKTEQEDEGQEGKEDEDLMDDFFAEVEAVSQPKPAKADAPPEKKRIRLQLTDLGASAAQIDRLLQSNYEWKNLNPFHVLDVPHRVDDPAVLSTRYRALSLLVHPDKCPADPERAKAAFEQVRGAMAILTDDAKRRHARNLAEQGQKQGRRDWEAAGEGRPRGDAEGDAEGLARAQATATMKIFAEIEHKRRNIERRKRKYEQRERAQEDEEKGKERSERDHDKRWREGERVEQRIGSWRAFQGGGKGGKKAE